MQQAGHVFVFGRSQRVQGCIGRESHTLIGFSRKSRDILCFKHEVSQGVEDWTASVEFHTANLVGAMNQHHVRAPIDGLTGDRRKP